MAHYMAKNMSRFLYSHDSCWLPVHGLAKLIKDEKMVMTFRNIGDSQKCFHASMHYAYRPQAMEKMCFYQYYSQIEFMNRATATKEDREHFEFTENHPFAKNDVAVYRSRICVLVFPWNWIGATKAFATSMFHPVSIADTNYKMREEYAFKFMLLFLPFRNHSDLLQDGSYQLQWVTEERHGNFSAEMLEIAENVQTIHNSLEASIPGNTLTSETVLVEADDFPEVMEEDENDSDLMANIGELFAATSGGNKMTEDAATFNPTFSGKSFKEDKFIPESVEERSMESVIEFDLQEEPIGEILSNGQFNGRFETTTSELNTLAMQQLLRVHETNQGPENVALEKKVVNANGTWQSIAAWAMFAQLDIEQQTAFEILVATYVLTFYEDAKNSEGNDAGQFLLRKEELHVLTRQGKYFGKPLRMFVTGPAGAGKCKFR